MKVWDCSGLEYPVSFDRVMYLEAHVILICFDISNPDSFDNLSEGVGFNVPFSAWGID